MKVMLRASALPTASNPRDKAIAPTTDNGLMIVMVLLFLEIKSETELPVATASERYQQKGYNTTQRSQRRLLFKVKILI